MGTWNSGIFGNDTSCEVKEYFFEQYNSGKEPADIQREILQEYAESLDDKEERYDVLLATAHCLWQTKAMDEALLAEIKQIVADGSDLTVRRNLGADAQFLRSRDKALRKLLADIQTPKETAKKRVKPPVPVDSVYRNGCCLAFQYEDGKWGVVITAGCEFYKRKATLLYAQTDIKQAYLPTLDDVLAAHLLDDWFDRNSEYGHHHKLHLYGAHFLDSKEIARLNPYNGFFFTIIGYLPEWKDSYGSSSSGRQPYTQDTCADFARIIRNHFTCTATDKKPTVETVEEINWLFCETALDGGNKSPINLEDSHE
jgi:hypothetical protein